MAKLYRLKNLVHIPDAASCCQLLRGSSGFAGIRLLARKHEDA